MLFVGTKQLITLESHKESARGNGLLRCSDKPFKNVHVFNFIALTKLCSEKIIVSSIMFGQSHLKGGQPYADRVGRLHSTS